jgi:hypothetical protein
VYVIDVLFPGPWVSAPGQGVVPAASDVAAGGNLAADTRLLPCCCRGAAHGPLSFWCSSDGLGSDATRGGC